MMETIDLIQSENIALLTEIVNLKINLNKLYNKTGPSSTDYISQSIELDFLMNKYFEEKISILKTV